MQLGYSARLPFERNTLSRPVALIVALDPDARPLRVPDSAYVLDRLDVPCHDISADAANLVTPTSDHARAIVAFGQQCRTLDRDILAICEAGAGRSAAIAAGLCHVIGAPPSAAREVLRKGTYNRRLYRLICAAAGMPVTPDAKVSIAVRIKYPLDRLQAFVACLRRQRWSHWECIAVTDGPNWEAAKWIWDLNDGRVVCIQTEHHRGRWGHPWRQVGIDACTGDYISLQNDDNYLTPGFMEQSVMALEDDDADVCLVNYLHSYKGWEACRSEVGSSDLGAWLARAALVHDTPWDGDEFDSDNTYLSRLAEKARRVTTVTNCLFVHN
jgi:predicted protein tyrosine phosphatase